MIKLDARQKITYQIDRSAYNVVTFIQEKRKKRCHMTSD